MGFIRWVRWLIDKQFFAFIGLLLIISGLLVSRAFMSIGMITLCASALLGTGFIPKLKQFFKLPALWLITVFFLLVAISGLYSDNLSYFSERLQIKLPLLGLPLAIYCIKPFNRKFFFALLYVFMFIVIAGSGWTILQTMSLTSEEIIDLYSIGQVLPTPVHHIRFSLMVVLAFVIGLYVLEQKFYWVSRKEHILIVAFMVFLFVFAHVLAVKTGLLTLYILIIVLGVKIIYQTKRYLMGGIIVLSMLVAPIIGYYTIDSLHQKVNYFMYDMNQYFEKNNIDNLSDARRLRSYKVAFEAASESVLFGSGYGDIEDACNVVYQKNYPDTNKDSWLLPHSQFVYVYVGLGWVGVIFFVLMILMPFYHHSGYKDIMVLSIGLIGLISFISEYTLETQIGTALYVTFIIISLTHYYNSIEHDSPNSGDNNI